MAALFLVPLWWMIEGRGAFQAAHWLRGMVIGGSTIGIGAFLLVIGQGLTNEVTVAIISASMPLIGMALEVGLDGRRITVALVLGIALSFAGGLMALGSGGGVALGVGALLCFVSVVIFTLGSRLSVTALPTLSPLGRTAVTVAGAALTTGAGALIWTLLGGPQPDWAVLGWGSLGALAIYALMGMAISQVLWIVSVGHLGIGLASLHINATPFYVMILLFALGSPWVWAQALGALIVGVGVLVAQGMFSPKAITTDQTG